MLLYSHRCFLLPFTPSLSLTHFTVSRLLRLARNPFSGSYPPSSSFLHLCRGCRNICLLSIHYAFRPRVRSRLPQSGRTFLWIPWASGVQDSHLHLATYTGILTSMTSNAPSGTSSPFMERSPTISYRSISNPQLRYYA